MNPFDLALVAFNEFLGGFVHMGSSASSNLALTLGLI